jgi:hypothetical protein
MLLSQMASLILSVFSVVHQTVSLLILATSQSFLLLLMITSDHYSLLLLHKTLLV